MLCPNCSDWIFIYLFVFYFCFCFLFVCLKAVNCNKCWPKWCLVPFVHYFKRASFSCVIFYFTLRSIFQIVLIQDVSSCKNITLSIENCVNFERGNLLLFVFKTSKWNILMILGTLYFESQFFMDSLHLVKFECYIGYIYFFIFMCMKWERGVRA